MSRIGKLPIDIPSGVKVEQTGSTVKATGPLGSLHVEVRPEVEVLMKDAVIEVIRKDDSRMSACLHGLTRTLIANMVKGVSEGFEKKLDIVGVGYRADVQGNVLNLSLGFSHPVRFELPEGIQATVDRQTSITIKGADKQVVGHVAAVVRGFRPPEPYKGKGVMYAGEKIIRKAGKAGKAGG